MKKEARILLDKAVDYILLGVELLDSQWDRGRSTGVLVFLDHSFEMLLKACIVHLGGKIADRGSSNMIGFDACVALSKTYAAAARSMRLWVRTRSRISFFWLTHRRARSAEPSSRLTRENPLSTCQRWP